MIKAQLVNLAARIPAELKRSVDEYCLRNGLKMQFFVTQALRDKLVDLQEDQQDIALAEERLTAPEFVGESGMNTYLKSRKKK